MPNLRLPLKRPLLLALCCAALLGGAGGCGPGGGGSQATYAITFSLSTAPAPLDTLGFKVAYQGGGSFIGEGTSVQCTRLPGAATADATYDDDDTDTLQIDLEAGATPLEAVSKIVRCLFTAEEQPTTGNFTVTITEAVDEDGNDAKNQTQVLVTSIVLDSGSSSTDHYVTFRVTSAHVGVGALQFDVDFTGDEGAFAVGDGNLADCTNLAPNSTMAASVIDTTLRVGLISLSGFATPANVARCRFVATTAPVADDFDITVNDATTISDVAIDPDMIVSSITTGTP